MHRIVMLILLISALTLNVEGSQAQSTPDEIVATFFKLYEEKGSGPGIDYVFTMNKWMARNQDGLSNLKSQLKNLINIVGRYYGHEEIIKTTIGSNYMLATHMVRYDRQPVRFSFLFYRPDQKWQVQNFEYDDKLDDELEEATKLHRLAQKFK